MSEMVGRDEIIKQKSEEILEGLKAWCEENQMLLPGEQIVFEMKIIEFPTVIQGNLGEDSVLSMKAVDFFTPQRLRNRHISASSGIIQARNFRNNLARRSCRNITVEKFIRRFSFNNILKWTNFSRDGANAISLSLQEVGLKLRLE